MIPAVVRRSLFSAARSSQPARAVQGVSPWLPRPWANARGLISKPSFPATSALEKIKVSWPTCSVSQQSRSLSSVTGAEDGSQNPSDASLDMSPAVEPFNIRDMMKKYDVLKIRQELETMPNQKMTVQEFVALCARFQMHESDSRNLLRAFHEASIVFNFSSSSSAALCNTVFIKPKDVLDTVWATFDLGGSVSLAEIEQKQAELIVLKSEFRALDTAKRLLDQTAESQADRAVWIGGLLPVGTFVGLCRMTYWEFSWDIVEPISFFVSTMGPICFFYVWFASTKEDFTMAAWRQGMIDKSRETLYRAKAFDLKRYEAVAEAIRLCEEDIRLLKQG